MSTTHIPRPILRRIREIRNDHRSGSIALARRAGETLARLTHAPAHRADFHRQLILVCRALTAAQPQMAAILNLCNAALRAAEDTPEADAARASVRAAVEDYLQAVQTAAKEIAQSAAVLISDGMTVATHSYSSAVRDALRNAAAAGRKFRVALTESRPLLEGVALAKELASAGIPVSFGVDAAMALLLEDSNLVLVGADAVTDTFLLNKAGTFPAALVARRQGIPFYALAGSEKFAPPKYRFPPEASKEPSEVLRRVPRGVEIRNLYFDQTPLKLVTALITEKGALDSKLAVCLLRKLSLHPALMSADLLEEIPED